MNAFLRVGGGTEQEILQTCTENNPYVCMQSVLHSICECISAVCLYELVCAYILHMYLSQKIFFDSM